MEENNPLSKNVFRKRNDEFRDRKMHPGIETIQSGIDAAQDGEAYGGFAA